MFLYISMSPCFFSFYMLRFKLRFLLCGFNYVLLIFLLFLALKNKLNFSDLRVYSSEDFHLGKNKALYVHKNEVSTLFL